MAETSDGHVTRRTIPIRQGEGFDVERVWTYLRQRIPRVPEELPNIEQFPSGASNLTYYLQSGPFEGVLRRPPFGPLPPKAHDMAREAAILEKLHPNFPLAPRPLAFCDDLSVIGSPFYIMEYRPGVVLDDRFPSGIAPQPELCQRISCAVVDTLADLHSVDYEAALLAEFGHPDGFLARQVHGWIERYQRAQTDDIRGVEHLTRWLAQRVPVSQAVTVIHNDFKLNNIVLDASALDRPVAVVDWEMATIGDPLMDLAISLSYWVQADDPVELRQMLPTVTQLPGFLSRRDLIERYAKRTGRDLSTIDYYLVFAYFKLAVILQQIYVRWKGGQTADERFASFGARVATIVAHAVSAIEEAGA
ncbi:phosphotransferase family protein [Alicyclobacillus sp. ALC3]|uniref:phosphotransferase family protein n=1 Tax=Alicyclobacillus sp. ALC3 TaxID=2796143 RepID=UPI002377E412|nr:phosphotransferase family protein [Alicyclobacillus sp. ALC3]